jgi:uncharacterized membrane protein YfcA
MGGKGLKSIVGVETCDAVYWILYALEIVIIFAIGAVAWWILMKENSLYLGKANEGKTQTSQLTSIFTIGLISGFLGGLTGIGGGAIMVPAMTS